MNVASIQFKKIEKKITQLNKKLNKIDNLQYRLSKTQKQFTLMRQNALKIDDKLNHEINNWKT